MTSYDGTVKVDNTTKRQYTVASNEETYTLYMPATSTAVAAGDLVAFAPTSDDTYADNDVDVITSGAVYVDEYSETDSTLTFFTTVVKGSAGEYTGVDRNTLALDDDCAIVYVDADGDAAGSDIGIGEFDSVNGYKNAAIVTKEVDGEDIIVAIFVETSGECDILSSTLSEGMTDSQIKDLDDGIYVPADGDFTTSGNVTGNPEDNIIVKFTVKEATTKVSLSVSDGTTEYMNSGSPLEFTGLDWAADSDHFIFFHVYGGDNNPDLSAGGTFTVTVKDVDNNSTLYSGPINVAPKGE